MVLASASGQARVICFASQKSRQVVRLVLGAAIFTFVDGVDEALLLRHDFRILLVRYLPYKALTDSPSMFRIRIRSTTTTERHLMIYLQAASEGLDRRDISEVGWIERSKNISYLIKKFAPYASMMGFRNSLKLE